MIRRLPETLVNRIAAGEVVERPASAVKELLENSLDAGASTITVVVRDGGRTEIVVVDDGSGIDVAEMPLAVERHATSKLPHDDLRTIETLGFRGEALPSIGAVARLTITSRTADADTGWAIRVSGGEVTGMVPAAHPVGTRVEVCDLFFATPARLKFLKAATTEQGHILEAVQRLAIAHPHVAFTVSDGRRTLLRLPHGRGETGQARRERLQQVLGADFARDAVPVLASHDGLQATGYAALPTLHRRTSAEQFLFVNGRPVRDRLIHAAVRVAYQGLIAADRHPLVALFLEVAVDDVDVNVHPMKTEVRFRDPGRVRGTLITALKQALAAAGVRTASTVATPIFRMAERGSGGWQAGQAVAPAGVSGDGLQEAAAAWIWDQPAPVPAENEAGSEVVEDASACDPSSASLPLGSARAQLHGTYIIAETSEGVVIVDQHAAHERLTQARLEAALLEGGVARQCLLIPEVVELGEAAAGRVLARAPELADCGLVVEAFGTGTVLVREVPALLGHISPEAMIRDIAEDLVAVGEAVAVRERLRAVCARMACHGSVRAGRILNLAEMNALLRQMEATPHTGQCSHGRPTYVALRWEEIERLFGRR